MEKRKGVKLEIIVDQLNIPQVIKILEKSGIKGYTIFRGLTGNGNQGYQDGEGLSELFTNAMIVAACSEEQMFKCKIDLEKFIKLIGGLYLVSQIEWFG